MHNIQIYWRTGLKCMVHIRQCIWFQWITLKMENFKLNFSPMWHTVGYPDPETALIRYSYAATWLKYGKYTHNCVFECFFCAYETWFKTFIRYAYVTLIRYSVTAPLDCVKFTLIQRMSISFSAVPLFWT